MSVLSMHKSNGQEDGAQLIIVSLMTLKGHKFETLEKQETSRFQKKKIKCLSPMSNSEVHYYNEIVESEIIHEEKIGHMRITACLVWVFRK